MDKSSRTESFLAVVIGTSALAIAAYTAILQRQQTRAQVWPSIAGTRHISRHDSRFGDGGTEAENRWSLVLRNRGTGPGRVRYFSVSFEGKPLKTWRELLGHLGVDGSFSENEMTLTDESVLAAGEELNVYELTGGSNIEKLLGANDRISYSICYCSLLDECWMNENGHQTPVQRCPKHQGFGK